VNPTSKTQVDRLGDRLKKGKVGDEDVRQLDDFRRSFSEAYEEVVNAVRKATQLEPTGRPAKSTTSIIEKLRRETIRLSQMQDIAGCRLVVEDVPAQDSIVAQLKAALPDAVLVDRRKQPSYGYRAVHIIAKVLGRPVEIQIRTELQHLWAQLSEKLSDVVDSAIKYGGGEPEVQMIMSEGSEIIGEMDELEIELASLKQREGEASELQEQKGAIEEFVRLKKKVREQLEQSIARLEGLSRKRTGD
jgi:GTP pyrophosphokinase